MRKIWFIYGAIVFFSIVILVFPFYLIAFFVFGKMSIRPLIWCSHRIVARGSLLLMLIHPKIIGRAHIKAEQQYIMVSNHQAAIDVLLYAIAPPFLFKFLAKKEMKDIPFFGYVARRISVLVDRQNAESRRESLLNMRAALDDGYSVFLAPEGTRNRSNEILTRFYEGAFRLAIETKTPLLVLTLAHPGRLNDPRKMMDLSPGIVRCYFDAPIDTSSMTLDDLPELVEKTKAIMLKHLNEKR